MNYSKFMTINQRDLLRGLGLAVASAIATQLVAVLQAGSVPTMIQLKYAALAGISTGLTYLIKNVLTNSNDKFGKAEGK